MAIARSLPELIGHTPLLALERACARWGAQADVYAKLEYFNPLGSAKDRAARNMIDEAERRGELKPGATVIEPTSGNTGVALAYICATRGYRLILTMPESMSAERRMLLSALGAELVLTPAVEGMQGAVNRASELQAQTPGSWICGQFDNPDNAAAHETTTGPEILEDLQGKVDIFVAAVGTGGTLTGVGRCLKKANPACRIVAVEPASSPLLSEGRAGAHKIQGIGANFIPSVLDRALIDEILTVTDEEAYEMCRFLGRVEGLLVGISSGAAAAAAQRLALRPENQDKNLVVLLPDTGERYLSCGVYGV